MRKFSFFFACALGLFADQQMSLAQSPEAVIIDWEVANRFRLFAEQKEFDRHVEAMKVSPDGTILGAEHKLIERFGGRGWADGMGRLCFDSFKGRIQETCKRDGVDETYLNPPSIRIKLIARLPANFGDATCDWTVGPTNIAKRFSGLNCKDAVTDARAFTYMQTPVVVVARSQSGATLQGQISVQVRDVFIVGMGDSIASGEGNPTGPIKLSENGFCFHQLLSSSNVFWRPGREGFDGPTACDTGSPTQEILEKWAKLEARWLYSACHRCLYSYQTRTALAIAVQNPRISVTYLPLGCTGAEIGKGLLKSMQARERLTKNGERHPEDIEAQVSQLRNYLKSITANGRRRSIDLLLLTIGANDMGFSGLVANIVMNDDRLRNTLKKLIVTPGEAAARLNSLRADFRKLRVQLRPVMGGSLERTVFTTYFNPSNSENGVACPNTRIGFDINPGFAVDSETLKKTSSFVDEKFLPTVKNYVTCGTNGVCTHPARDRMNFVDSHLAQYRSRGFCAKAADDPEFDKQCFKNGNSFFPAGSGAGDSSPLTCSKFKAPAFAAYAKRARWVRTANDSYFSAMTYPSSSDLFSFLRTEPNLHDAKWGLTASVYGGALHPTSEGHAAMADAALPAARKVLRLPEPTVATAAR